MAFSYTTENKEDMGSQFSVTGTYTNGGGDTGGDIVTGLDRVSMFFMQPTGAAVLTEQPVVNATFPLASGTVPVVQSNSETGLWMAIGR